MEDKMPVFPGTRAPEFIDNCTIEKNGFNEKLLSLQSHTGTHIDAPFHIFSDGKSLSDFALNAFCGKAICLEHTIENPLTTRHVNSIHNSLKKVDFVLIYTGWSQYWHTIRYFDAFPVPDTEVLNMLVSYQLKGLGIDTISVDQVKSEDLLNHRLLLGNDLIIIENLTNLRPLLNVVFDFFCFPLHINKGDGSPVRAVART
jgi:arylformamidase